MSFRFLMKGPCAGPYIPVLIGKIGYTCPVIPLYLEIPFNL